MWRQASWSTPWQGWPWQARAAVAAPQARRLITLLLLPSRLQPCRWHERGSAGAGGRRYQGPYIEGTATANLAAAGVWDSSNAVGLNARGLRLLPWA